MAGQSTIFPIFLRAEYRDDGGIKRFQSDAMRAAKAASGEINKVGAALDGIFSARRSGGSLDLGLGGLKAAIDAQRQLATASREVADAALRAAQSNGGFDASLRRTAAAARDSAKAQEAELLALQQKLPLLERVQAELSQSATAVSALTGENLRLAQAEAGAANGATMLAAIYRGTSAELGRVANSARESASAFELMFQAQEARSQAAGQAFFNTAAGLDRQAKSARASADAFEFLFAEQERAAVSARRITDTYLSLAQAEARAADGGRMLQAIYRGTAEELGRVANSARESAAVFAAQAASLASLRAQINPTAAAQEQFAQKVAFAKAALDRGELSQMEYARAVKLASAALREAGQAEVAATAALNGLTVATRRGTTARGNVINSARSERTAFIQLGQQLQDMTVQAQMGTNAFIIMGQQLPQVAFALTGLENSTNKTKAAVGRFATLMAGPFGAAVFIGIAALGPLVQMFLSSRDAAEDSAQSIEELIASKQKSAIEARNAEKAEDAFRLTLDGVTDSIERNRKGLEDLNAVKRTSAELTLDATRKTFAEAAVLQFNTQQQLINAQALLQAQIARASGPGQGSDLAALGLEARAERVNQLIEGLVTGSQNLAKAQDALRRAEVSVAIDQGVSGEEGRIKRFYAERIDALREEALARGLNSDQIRAEAAALKEREDAELSALRKSGRSPRTRVDRAAREAERPATFGERAAEQIQRINERFDEQPRLIDAASQATRQLDSIIAELAERKPVNFRQMIEDAEEAKLVIEDALLRPVEDILRLSNERLDVERLIAQGRVDEAVALQEIQRLEKQIGKLSEQQKNDILDQIAFEAMKTRELRAQAELLELQADVARTVADSLRDVFSGRGTFGDLIKNFRQSLQDLQGARLFEDLFGDSFRAIEEDLRGNTPQGRANARYVAEVEKTADATEVTGEAALRLAGAFDQAFGIVTGAANDNGGLQEIVVSRTKARDIAIARPSIMEIADRISRGVSAPIAAQLEDLLGPRFAGALGDVIGGVFKGQVLAGNVGSVLGGIEGLLGSGILGNDNRLTAQATKALGGAAAGSQVAGLSKLLGLGGSTTGAQLGGAAGAFLPFPGGDIVGAIAGNILGGLLKGTKRGSATIGGSGGSLAITGTRGNSSSRREASSGLAGSVLDAIDSLAEQLGATVDSSRGSVSLGLRKDNIRLDRTGQGRTKTSRGAIDFGDDAEAAIRAATLDLIQDGVIAGLKASEQRLLQTAKDVEQGLRDVLTFRSVFDRLAEIRDPLGFAITQLNREFEGLIELFTRAGASTEEFAELEELYNLERARAIEDATDRVVGSLRQLLNDLTIGDSGLSLRSRRANAVSEFDGLAARVQAGDASAFDDFAEISQQLLDIERQLFGSTQSYFDRLAQITALTEQAIAGETNVTGIGGANTPSPFDDRAQINRSIDTMNEDVTGWLQAINDNLIALNPASRTGGGSGSGGFGSGVINALQIANF